MVDHAIIEVLSLGPLAAVSVPLLLSLKFQIPS